jgi:hypothetical protein
MILLLDCSSSNRASGRYCGYLHWVKARRSGMDTTNRWAFRLACPIHLGESQENHYGAFEAEEGAAINPKAFPLKLA